MKPKADKPAIQPKIGRPSLYSDELCDKLCLRLISGESLRTICKDEHFPTFQTICNWLLINQSFFEQYARARAMQSEIMADEILAIADDSSKDTLHTFNGGIENTEWTNRSKLRVDARLKLMAILNPKRFGNKVDVTTKGDKVIAAVQINYVFPEGWKPPEIEQ